MRVYVLRCIYGFDGSVPDVDVWVYGTLARAVDGLTSKVNDRTREEIRDVMGNELENVLDYEFSEGCRYGNLMHVWAILEEDVL